MDFSDQRTMIAAEQRAQFFADAEFELAGGVALFSEIGYSVNEVTDRVGNMLLFRGNVQRTNEFFVPANHPFKLLDRSGWRWRAYLCTAVGLGPRSA